MSLDLSASRDVAPATAVRTSWTDWAIHHFHGAVSAIRASCRRMAENLSASRKGRVLARVLYRVFRRRTDTFLNRLDIVRLRRQSSQPDCSNNQRNEPGMENMSV